MKITKTKLIAGSFGAALSSLYATPELTAQVDSVPNVVDLSFVPGTVPVSGGPDSAYSTGIMVAFNGLFDNMGQPIDVRLLNNSYYGFVGIGSPIFGGVVTSFVRGLEPGDAFSGGSESIGTFSFFGTGIHTIGFVIAGEVGYFRADLGDAPGGVVTLLDGQVAVGSDGTDATNDFVITIPPLPGDDDVVLGDVDGDGDVDFEDIPAFVGLLTGGGFQAEADIDGDGDVDFEDIPLFIQLLTGGSVNTQAGLPGLAMGVTGLRARRMAVTA